MELPRITLLSDDEGSGEVWGYLLTRHDYNVTNVTSVPAAIRDLNRNLPSLFLIQDMGEHMNGPEAVRQLRQYATQPILLLTDGDNRRVLDAYSHGADECIVEPVSHQVFLAKVSVWLRWAGLAGLTQPLQLQQGPVLLDMGDRSVLVDGNPVALTDLEFRLLQYLMRNANRVVRSEALIQHVWHHTPYRQATPLKNVIYRLRRKIEPDPARPQYIVTVTNEGYSFQS